MFLKSVNKFEISHKTCSILVWGAIPLLYKTGKKIRWPCSLTSDKKWKIIFFLFCKGAKVQKVHKTPFQYFSVPQTPILTKKSQNFPIFCSKCLNLVNFQFLSLKIGQNPVQEVLFGPKIKAVFLFLKKISSASTKCGPYPFYKPPFSAQISLPQKVEYPRVIFWESYFPLKNSWLRVCILQMKWSHSSFSWPS